MKFPWQKNKTAPDNAVKMMAAVVPKTYKFRMAKMVTENTFTADSYSTIITTARVIGLDAASDPYPASPSRQPTVGEFAVDAVVDFVMTGEFFEDGSAVYSDAGGQQIQFDAPNWVGALVWQEDKSSMDSVELPVWVDPATNKIISVDVEQLLVMVEPRRQEAREFWGKYDGPFALYHQIREAPKEIIETGKMVASLPGTWLGALKDFKDDLKGQGKPPEPLPDHMRPDLTQYPPIEEIDYETWALLSAKPQKIQELGVPQDKWVAANKEWMARMMKDWKLGAQYGNDIDRIRKTKE